jgi:glycerol transport system ATP-binding protein
VRRADARAPGAVPAEVIGVEELGRFRLVTARIGAGGGGRPLRFKLPEGEAIAIGDAAWLDLPPEWTTLFADGHAVR